ncbi:MAG: Asp-tRNA(Asn)/Glu-tRNA(Gln) amidotransferase subunit GatA [Acidobacteriia bacterium]|nr:Asp-tRNA(Asn)/Glu-tRNA(Gln) amidotransferase subunit GatA [Terriglobia bacterium]MYG03203.1 Asp-tRNA(Asn)/Glu-tRNA(Gln) amidotransferase subunit GatA [Terriglobia bacterium]MYK09441.1 Asp-tRNA(Asn)/Glu-tRNA(Gln) amidotransferase subunit GatA [Terriglobia bacterium]
MDDFKQLTVDLIQAGLRAKRFSARELAQEALRVAEAGNPSSGVYLGLTPERALAAACRVDAELAAGEEIGPLAGVPLAVKDVIMTRGEKTTCASRALEHFVAPYDATAVERVERAGAVIVGKTNCDEFAMGSSNENSAFFPVRNPAAPDRVPGGSSGGSAAAVAGGYTPISLGSDTGGSIRQPASFCGAVGIMPTYGRVSRYGLVAFASSLDHIGPFSRTVKDSALLLGTVAGPDPLDSTAASAPVPDYAGELDAQVRGLKIGIPKEYYGEGLENAVGAKVQAGVDLLRGLGCEPVEISLPHTPYAIASYYLICTAEASSNLARYDGVRYSRRSESSGTLRDMYRNSRAEAFGPEVTRRIILGTYVLSSGYYDAYYRKAQEVRALIARDFAEAFEAVDAIVTPVSPFPAFKLGEKTSDPLQMYLSDIYTITGSLAGIAGMSVPCGNTPEGLPVGLQILTNHFQEQTMLNLGHAFEQAGGFEG